MESRRGSNCNRSSAQPGYWHDQHVRPTEAIDCVKQAMVATTSGDTGLQEGCFSPSVGSCPAKETKPRKRKSRWDQPAETNPDSRSSERKEQKIESTLLQQCESRPSQGGVEVAVDHIDSVSRKNRNCPGCVQNQCQHDEATRADNERQNIPEDVPPGFSSPRALGTLNASSTVIDLHQQNVCHTKCPDAAIIGQPQEKFISRLPVSYGIPLSIVKLYGTPQEESAECWVIAPGMPFYPFPPLPQFPRDHKDHAPLHSLNPLTINQPVEEEHRDSNCPASYADETTPCANSQQTFKRARDSSYDLGRRYFRQQKWNNTKLGPPWIRKRNGWEHMGDNSRGETCSIGIENVENEPKNSYLSEDVGCRVEKAGNFFYQHSQHQDHHWFIGQTLKSYWISSTFFVSQIITNENFIQFQISSSLSQVLIPYSGERVTPNLAMCSQETLSHQSPQRGSHSCLCIILIEIKRLMNVLKDLWNKRHIIDSLVPSIKLCFFFIFSPLWCTWLKVELF